jgi:hypothetical protein
MGKWIVPRAVSDRSPTDGGAWADSEFSARYPALAGWLGDVVDDEGKARDTGTLLVFCDGPQVKCCLRDRQSGCFAFLTARTIVGLFQAADEALSGGDADWRAGAEKKNGRK